MKRNNLLKYLLVLISLLWYYLLYYQVIRADFLFLISGVLILGGIYIHWVVFEPFTKKEIIGIAILFRIVFLFEINDYSDDYNRFIWDGKILLEGENPYEYTPTQLVENGKQFGGIDIHELYAALNSKDYYTVYPPLNQFLFATSTYLGGNVFWSVVWMKIFILVFEIGLIFLLFKMLKKLKLKESLAQIYALNPLVILELTGNVHFEGIMLFFFMLGLWFLMNKQILVSGLAIALAINVKVIPVLFLPLFLPLLGILKSVKLFFVIALVSLALVFPFISETLISNFSESLNLYFQSFEFNASIYYIFKGISHYFLGYKTELIGIIIPISVFLFAMYITFLLFKKNRLNSYDGFDMKLFISHSIPLLFVYYVLASTIHPWYIINLLVLCVFNRKFSILIWSILAFLSYFAYSHFVSNGDFHASTWYYILIAIEYSIVILFFIFEQRKFKHSEA